METAQQVPDQVPPLRVGFILLDQFTMAGFAGVVDALRLAADAGGVVGKSTHHGP